MLYISGVCLSGVQCGHPRMRFRQYRTFHCHLVEACSPVFESAAAIQCAALPGYVQLGFVAYL
jgi:hypothetical protein